MQSIILNSAVFTFKFIIEVYVTVSNSTSLTTQMLVFFFDSVLNSEDITKFKKILLPGASEIFCFYIASHALSEVMLAQGVAALTCRCKHT